MIQKADSETQPLPILSQSTCTPLKYPEDIPRYQWSWKQYFGYLFVTYRTQALFIIYPWIPFKSLKRLLIHDFSKLRYKIWKELELTRRLVTLWITIYPESKMYQGNYVQVLQFSLQHISGKLFGFQVNIHHLCSHSNSNGL